MMTLEKNCVLLDAHLMKAAKPRGAGGAAVAAAVAAAGVALATAGTAAAGVAGLAASGTVAVGADTSAGPDEATAVAAPASVDGEDEGVEERFDRLIYESIRARRPKVKHRRRGTAAADNTYNLARRSSAGCWQTRRSRLRPRLGQQSRHALGQRKKNGAGHPNRAQRLSRAYATPRGSSQRVGSAAR